ncbi:MAG: sulfatase-like hydrolase/transferase [Terriglobia bacterium]|jgi:arylsulfatase A-like enzyme
MSHSKSPSARLRGVSRREFLQRSAATAALPALAAGTESEAAKAQSGNRRRPNVIVIHADQMRWDAVGAYGLNPMGLTPNLDAMAKKGTLFTQAITNQPVCAPSRACLWTGQYAARHGVWRNGLGMARDATTIATALRQEGYTANYIGKWHLAEKTTGPVSAEDRGGFLDLWEASNVLEFTSHAYEGDLYDGSGNPLHFSGIYRIDFMTQRAVRFLQNPGKEPFFLVVSYIEPHYQNDQNSAVPPEGYAERYANPFVPHDLRCFPGDWIDQLPKYYGCIARIDEAVGTILDTLQKSGLDENTLVVFTSDHGCHFRTRNTVYKRSAHESSVHVPLIVQGPGFNRSQTVDQLVSMVDIAPTILNAAGASIPLSMQGRSALPLVEGNADGWRNEVFIQTAEFMVGRALRTERWTYVVGVPKQQPQVPSDPSDQYAQHDPHNLTGGSPPAPWSDHYAEYQLYDLYADPHQLVNLAGRDGTLQTAETLRKRLMLRMKEAGDKPAEISPPLFPYS